MREIKYITTKQRKVLDDLFAREVTEEEALERHRVSRATYANWHAMGCFADEYKRRLKQVWREGELIIAKFSQAAASRLVQLTQSKREETARKACLDVMNHFNRKRKKGGAGKEQAQAAEEWPDLSPELASNLLAVIANDRKQKFKKADTEKAQ